MGDVAETVTSGLPGLGIDQIGFTATKLTATDTITFSDYRLVKYCGAMTAGADDPVTAQSTNIVTFSVGTGTIYGIAWVVK